LSLLDDSEDKQAKVYANWITNIEVPLHRDIEMPLEISTTDRQLFYSSVYELTEAGKLSSNNAKTLLEDLLTGKCLSAEIEEYATKMGYIQVSDVGAIESIVDSVLASNPKPAEDVKNGEMKAIGFLVGQVMKLSAGKANPAMVQKIIREKLGV
jgi:aspartyl-tRNA(Asn)/glutamyl-tRNA(Gln) amidotransferase subunit B